ncbi:multicopper oxidase family protein [Saccharopolyspora taberi]|uniref:Multicopper oxidase family protein n=1 Tax=Saccharopolyspora taberi TaxID=60895 RepID=A0ABN3VCI1_9PSEU
MTSRRTFVKIAVSGAAVGAAAAAFPLRNLFSGPGNAAAAGAPAASVPFSQPMPIPPVLRPARSTLDTDFYELRMRYADVEIVPGVRSRVRTYGGVLPGPTVRAHRGRKVVVRQHNDLDLDAAVHLHGGHVAPEHDGHPMDVIAPGANREYHYDNDQRAASLWYHDHAHHSESENVYNGLHGSYLISDPLEAALGLPGGQYDVPLQIRDARVEADGKLTYTRAEQRPHMLVNGKERPYFRVEARRYRLRLFNVSIDRPMLLRLSDGAEFTQIATDGGLLAEPVRLSEILMSAGERAEVVIDFGRYRAGSSVALRNAMALPGENQDFLRFDVVPAAGRDTSAVPPKLAELEPLPPATAERSFVLDMNKEQGTFLINGLLYDPHRVDVRTELGATEVWSVTNPNGHGEHPNFLGTHNFHTHLTHFRVLDRNGAPPAPYEQGWKDTVEIGPGETVRIAMSWGPHPGRYVYHCHRLPHSANAQMGTIEIVG